MKNNLSYMIEKAGDIKDRNIGDYIAVGEDMGELTKGTVLNLMGFEYALFTMRKDDETNKTFCATGFGISEVKEESRRTKRRFRDRLRYKNEN